MTERIIEIRNRALSADHIESLAKGKIYAVILKSFYDKTVLNSALEKIINFNGKGVLKHASEFERIGYAYSEIQTEDDREKYHDNALNNIHTIRDLFKPAPHPIDEFRLLLDKTWPNGANLLEINQQKCFVGICRFLNPNIDLLPHTDKLERNLSNSQKSSIQLESQLSANIYISMPQIGGEVEFWDIEPPDKQYYKLMAQRHYGIARTILPKPNNIYKPQQGDLLILNSRKIHAVRSVKHAPRITTSCFIGYHGKDLPLSYWS
ncbi:MAG: 2OG-Fe(II) oxygenase [Gammaproteobacteria bacterium]|nr:2OG-Fe(II) oxygenase [Gammaproteobacteria bacterium]